MQRLGNNIHLTNLYGVAVLPNAKKVEKTALPYFTNLFVCW